MATYIGVVMAIVMVLNLVIAGIVVRIMNTTEEIKVKITIENQKNRITTEERKIENITEEQKNKVTRTEKMIKITTTKGQKMEIIIGVIIAEITVMESTKKGLMEDMIGIERKENHLEEVKVWVSQKIMSMNTTEGTVLKKRKALPIMERRIEVMV